MVRFFIIFFTISALLSGYIIWRLFGKASFRRHWKIAMAAGIVVTLFAPVITIILRRSGFDNLGLHLLTWVGYLGVGFLSFVFPTW